MDLSLLAISAWEHVGESYSLTILGVQVGTGRILLEGTQVALLGYGSMVQQCLAAHTILTNCGVSVTVADARFCKPLDHSLIRELAKNHQVLITVEEGSIGGFGSHVAQFMALDGLLDSKLKVWKPLPLLMSLDVTWCKRSVPYFLYQD